MCVYTIEFLHHLCVKHNKSIKMKSFKCTLNKIKKAPLHVCLYIYIYNVQLNSYTTLC